MITSAAGHDTARSSRTTGRVLGVIGGMGPAATADFYRKLIAATPASTDQEHVPVVILADPDIPDRSRAISSGQHGRVLSELRRRVDLLRAMGVAGLAIPCNTAHWWLPDLRATTTLPFISMIEASTAALRSRHPDATSVLVLGTRATVQAGIYAKALRQCGVRPVLPTEDQQTVVDQVVRKVKGGDVPTASRLVARAVDDWAASADVVVLACSELPLAAQSFLSDVPLVDSTRALAEACVTWAYSAGKDAP